MLDRGAELLIPGKHLDLDVRTTILSKLDRLCEVLPMGSAYLVAGGALEKWRKVWVMRRAPLTQRVLDASGGMDVVARVFLFVAVSELCRKGSPQSTRARAALRTGRLAERAAFDRAVTRSLCRELLGHGLGPRALRE